MESSTTRMTMRATASHDTRRSLDTVVLSMRWAHHATMFSTSRVCRGPGRAYRTSSARTVLLVYVNVPTGGSAASAAWGITRSTATEATNTHTRAVRRIHSSLGREPVRRTLGGFNGGSRAAHGDTGREEAGIRVAGPRPGGSDSARIFAPR